MVQMKSWSGKLLWTDNYESIYNILNYNVFIKLQHHDCEHAILINQGALDIMLKNRTKEEVHYDVGSSEENLWLYRPKIKPILHLTYKVLWQKVDDVRDEM